MKPALRDYLSVVLSFAAVLLCGYGIGFTVAERRMPDVVDAAPTSDWPDITMERLARRLELRPEQLPKIEAELDRTASAIRRNHVAAVSADHRHLLELYERIIGLVDPQQAAQLKEEKISLELRIGELESE